MEQEVPVYLKKTLVDVYVGTLQNLWEAMEVLFAEIKV